MTYRKAAAIKVISLILCAIMLLQTGLPVLAEDEYYEEYYEEEPVEDPHMPAYYEPALTDSLDLWPQAPAIEGKSAVVIDLQYGGILYAKNPDEKLYPASITKVMTCLLACENLNMNDKFIMTESAAFGIEPGSSSIYADTDEVFTMEQALMALMLESANEIALRIAELVSGNVKKFSELMNARAREIGCTNTHFNNPHGLPDVNHYTTAHDMALIAKEAWMNPLFRKFCTEDYYNIPPTNKQPETRYMKNHHNMMQGMSYAYDGVLGGKTGYTTAAGNTLVTYARRGEIRLAVVVLNSISGAYGDTTSLLDYAFGNFRKLNMKVPEDADSIGNRFLPCEKYLIRNCGDVRPFYYLTRVYVMAPQTIGPKEIEVIKTHHVNAAGPDYNEVLFLYQGNIVGSAIQYERNGLAELLTDPSVGIE